MGTIKFTLNGVSREVESGVTIMTAAREAGIYIPGLCSHPDLPPAGICGLCAVEAGGRYDGSDNIVNACETLVEEGLLVETGTARILELRRERLAEILAAHPHACLTCAQQEGCSRSQCSSNVSENERCCPKLGNCELQKVARHIGISASTPRYYHKKLPVYSGPLFDRDLNLCIGCQRCLRICKDVRGVGALSVIEIEGKKLVAPTGQTLQESGCRFCASCVEVCPTGALMDRKQGFAGEAVPVPCRSSCPAEIDVPRFLRLLAAERFDESLAVIRERVPFPASLGRVCFHPCEDSCRRGRLDQPVSVCRSKRFAADMDSGWWLANLKKVPATGKRVAIIGAGPAGLSAAYFLARKGHEITVFESQPEAGGMMRYGIPAYRLPRDVLKNEIGLIESAGVEIKAGEKIDDFNDLFKKGYQAILISTGAQGAVRLGVEGEDLRGVMYGISFLRDVASGKPVRLGDTVAVVGGGNVAVDVARTALRLGAGEVRIYCVESAQEMFAHPQEVEEALAEGAVINHRQGILKISGRDGRVSSLAVAGVESVFDGEGRFNPRYINSTRREVPASDVIIAIGQRAELSFAGTGGGLETGGGRLKVRRDFSAGMPGLFACGDVVTGPSSVVDAIADGRKAASFIDIYLGGSGDVCELLALMERPGGHLGKNDQFLTSHRHGLLSRPWKKQACPAGECPPEEILTARFYEVEQGFDELMAVDQAGRCLQCDLRTYVAGVPLPPEMWLEFNPESLERVPEKEGVYQLLDAEKNIIAIAGTADLRRSLLERLDTGAARYFTFEEDPMYTQRESQLIQQYIRQHGHMPEGGGELDDLF